MLESYTRDKSWERTINEEIMHSNEMIMASLVIGIGRVDDGQPKRWGIILARFTSARVINQRAYPWWMKKKKLWGK